MARPISEAPVIRAVLSDSDGEIASSQSVNTELPAAALLADNTALPTTPIVGAALMGYDGTTLDLLRTKGTGWQGVVLVRSSDGTEIASGLLADSESNGNVHLSFSGKNALFNGATWDRQRGNTEGTLLASAARTATTNSAIQTNYNARGVALFLNITATPGGAETLSLYLTMVDPVTGVGGVTSATQLTIPAATTGPFALVMYPGLLNAAMPDSRGYTRNGALPRAWLVQVIHSAGGSWTYSLSYAYVV